MFYALLRKSIVFRALFPGLFILTLFPAFAQPEPMKFGKIEMKEMEMKFYDKDTAASAVVLADYGRSYYSYIGEDFQVNLERHVRIKILKKAGYELGDVRVPLWKSGLTEEKINRYQRFYLQFGEWKDRQGQTGKRRYF